MVDEEVENILREIRERVQAEQQQTAHYSLPAMGADADRVAVSSNGDPEPKSSEVLARIDAYLATTARAWDRLPPLVSNRTGRLARLELWVKRHLKRATRWYAWEQINFNAAVHHALRETLTALSDYEQRLSTMRSEAGALARQLEELHAEFNAQQAELKAQRAELNAQRAELNARITELDVQRAELHGYHEDLKTRLAETEAQRQELHARMLDEQRVCFKQLSVETTETSVLLDRVRREMESRLDKLEAAKRKS